MLLDYLRKGWSLVTGLLAGKGAIQIGKGNQSISSVTIGNTNGPVSIGNTVNVNYLPSDTNTSREMGALSVRAARLLFEASKSATKRIIVTTKSECTTDIATNNIVFGDPTDARSVATWKEALEELVDLNLVEPHFGAHHVIYKLTALGFQAAAQIEKDSIQQVDIAK